MTIKVTFLGNEAISNGPVIVIGIVDGLEIDRKIRTNGVPGIVIVKDARIAD